MVIGSDFVVIYPSGCKDQILRFWVAHRQNPAPTDSPLWDLDVFLYNSNPLGPVASSPSGGLVSPVEPLGWCFTDFTCPAPEDVLCCICVNRHRLLDLKGN